MMIWDDANYETLLRQMFYVYSLRKLFIGFSLSYFCVDVCYDQIHIEC